ncbi:hypothetical protein FHX37_1067 [Haloactinospora alba]|uniref:Haloacid dehalogenase-like hydrolase n=1 Tax=Haloactinospora alba TaxID=405555 RepID=A0A543NHC6_9ACTN|nr:haloacid dehalogenase-like hydrolase [Haloactinospora alba]TQN31174.1 hypothetical protein FHX37_1067 [Haloactinospora alba]
MRFVPRRRVLAAGIACSALVGTLSAASSAAADPDRASLEQWPGDQGHQLERMITRFSDKGEYATFDADNTIWKNDLEESLIPFLEMKGVLTRENIDPALKLVDFEEGESLSAYYNRLCEAGTPTCYAWAAQVFSGLSLGEAKDYVDELMEREEPIPTNEWEGGELVDTTVKPPEIYPAQRELITTLREHGISVYVVTAAHQELASMVVSDPQYGLDVPESQVIGVQTLLENPETGELGTGTDLREDGTEVTDAFEFTSSLSTPATWQSGKAGAIQERIDPVQRPVLAAGDSDYTDEHMLFYADAQHGGLRLFVDRDADYTAGIREEADSRAQRQKELNQPPKADEGWLFATPEELGVAD